MFLVSRQTLCRTFRSYLQTPTHSLNINNIIEQSTMDLFQVFTKCCNAHKHARTKSKTGQVDGLQLEQKISEDQSTRTTATIEPSSSPRVPPPSTPKELKAVARQYVKAFDKNKNIHISIAMLGLQGVGKSSLLSRVS
jgi:DNA replication protein DnaC